MPAPCASRSGRRSATTTPSSRRRELPFELTPERIRALCAPHTGVGSDGILLLRETEERGFVAEVAIYNPDGSEAELSGNGVRQAVMYLRRNGWAEHDSFSVRTAAGEIRPRIHGDLCTMDMGRARLRSEADFPAGGEDGTGTSDRGRPRVRLPVRAGRQPAVRDRGGRRAGGARPGALRAARSSATSCSRGAPTSPSGTAPATPRSARASSSAAWGRRWRPAPARPARPSRPCCAALDSPVTVDAGRRRSSRSRWGRTCT